MTTHTTLKAIANEAIDLALVACFLLIAAAGLAVKLWLAALVWGWLT